MSHGDLLSRFRMLVAANCAPELSPAARTVLAQILAHFNAQTGQCTPSFDRLARTSGLARRSVVRAVRELRETGWVEREHFTREDSKGYLANSFRPVFGRALQIEGAPDEGDRDETVPTLGTKRSPPPRDETVPRVGTKRCLEVGTKRSPKHSKKNTGKGTQGETPVSPTAFDTWWQGYPRKVGKDAARPVFARILASGRATLEQLMAGAQRYAADRQGEEPRFTKHPKAWLNGGHWEDEIAPKSRTRNQQGGFSALAYVEERMMDDE